MTRHRKGKSNKRSNPESGKSGRFVCKGIALLNALTTTSSSGLFVGLRYEIDTTLVSAWSGISQNFEKWKIHELTFEFIPIQPTTKVGAMCMTILEDPDDATPTTVTMCMSQRLSKMSSIYKPMRLTYVPKHTPWLFCRDSTTLDDRWEMPGDFFIGSVDTAEALYPGYVVLHYKVEFDIVISSSLNSLPPHIRPSKVTLSREPERTNASHDDQASTQVAKFPMSNNNSMNPPSSAPGMSELLARLRFMEEEMRLRDARSEYNALVAKVDSKPP